MILITRATANFGNSVIDLLLERGVPLGRIAALVSDRKKADGLLSKGIIVRIGDDDNYVSLVEAFERVDKLLLVSGTDFENRGKQDENVIKAAKEAGVKHIFYASYERTKKTENSACAFSAHTHSYAEKVIKERGMIYTIFRTNVYTDMQPFSLGENILETGVPFPAGDTPAVFNLRSNMAEAVATALIGVGHEYKEYFISNTEDVSLHQIPDALSDLSEKRLTYNSPDSQTHLKT